MAQIDVDVVDLLDDCDKWEIESVIEWLDNNNKLDKSLIDYDDEYIRIPETQTIQDELWNESILKLLKNRMGLSLEDERTILEISKKFI